MSNGNLRSPVGLSIALCPSSTARLLTALRLEVGYNSPFLFGRAGQRNFGSAIFLNSDRQ